MSVTVFIPGRAMPAGSKSAFRTHTGRINVTDSSGEKGKTWRGTIQAIAYRKFPGPLWEGPLRVTFMFLVDRPKGHYGSGKNTGRVRPTAPMYPAGRPDVLKLARAVEDALTGIVWKDDSQVVVEILYKFYARPEEGEKPGVYVTVAKITLPDKAITDRHRTFTREAQDGREECDRVAADDDR